MLACCCDCRNIATCPMPGKCATDKLIYRATVTINHSVKKYVRLMANKSKDRYGGHKQDFEDKEKENSTTRSAYMEAKERKQSIPNQVSRTRNLCNAEKYQIIFHPDQATLNSGNELFYSCRTKKSKLLIKVKKRKKEFPLTPMGVLAHRLRMLDRSLVPPSA